MFDCQIINLLPQEKNVSISWWQINICLPKFFNSWTYSDPNFPLIPVSILTFTHGNANSWSATAIPLLQSENTPISTGPITMEEASWIGSLVCIGGLTGNFLGGILINIIGQKKVLMLIIIPHVVSIKLLQ